MAVYCFPTFGNLMKSEARGLKITKIMSRNYNCIAYIMKPSSEKNAVLV